MRSVRHGVWTRSARRGNFIEVTSSGERSPGIDLVALMAGLAEQRRLSMTLSSLFRTGPRWETQIVGPINLAGGALVGGEGRASGFAPWGIAAFALSGEPRFQRYLGSRCVLTPEELKAFPA
jgi:hypothetical protein